MVDTAKIGLYLDRSLEISKFRFGSRYNQGGNAIIGVFLILLIFGQIKCGGIKPAGTLGFRSSNPFYLPFLFGSNGADNSKPRRSIMSNIIQFSAIQKPTKSVKSTPKKELTYSETVDALWLSLHLIEDLWKDGELDHSPMDFYEAIKYRAIKQKYSVGGASCQK